MFGLSDLVSLSMPEELGALYYWGTQGAHLNTHDKAITKH